MAVDIFSMVGLGAAAFVATDINNMFILMDFFAIPRYHTSHVIFGQFLGIGALVAVGLAGSLIALVIPQILSG